MDKIVIEKLKVYGRHGVYSEEKEKGQNFYVSAEIYMNTRRAGKSDNLEDTVNYAGLCEAITDFMENGCYNLIEAAAENLAGLILRYSSFINGVNLTISKPEAPVGLPFEDIRISIKRQWKKAYISFGSNMGDRMEHINNFIKKMNRCDNIRILKTSDIINTKPYGVTGQNDFLNGCLEIETYMEPEELLDYLNVLEYEEGRVRLEHWGPRTLDLDIIFYGNEIIHTERLNVPHTDMHNREFVLGPLNEIAPYAYHPELGKTVKQLFDGLQ